jgi:hypothetical protein
MCGAMNFGGGGIDLGNHHCRTGNQLRAEIIKNRDANWILTALYPQDVVVDSTFGSARVFNQFPTTTLPLKIKILDIVQKCLESNPRPQKKKFKSPQYCQNISWESPKKVSIVPTQTDPSFDESNF